MKRFWLVVFVLTWSVSGCADPKPADLESSTARTEAPADGDPPAPADSGDTQAPKDFDSESEASAAEVAPAPVPTVEPPNTPNSDAAHSSRTKPTNRLVNETSPYLRMHMHNPVDWYPWGPEAFEVAKRENKPLFLSVGYSSCYWCHVMERESFMDEEIAAYLNEHFVCVKVDREERPDVDTIYMLAVQLISRRGGWPMSVFMMPDGKPFFGGTYFPARDGDRAGAPGFLTILQRIQATYQENQTSLQETADKVTELIQQEQAGPQSIDGVTLDPALLDKVLGALIASFDEEYGGFGFNPIDPHRPKFPEASNLIFLLDQLARDEDADNLKMLTITLDGMAKGGMWDHLGGGFHRYSTDRFWRIPHFEKMLYDNGQLLTVYSRAYAMTGNEAYLRVVDQTVAFLMRELRDDGGAFYSALDAESERIEGKYYRWTTDELKSTLGSDYERFANPYGAMDTPNFEHDYHVPELEALLTTEQEAALKPLRAKLLQQRSQRVRPLTDDKILCGWNGLVIRGLADAGRLCERPEYIRTATEAAEFILDKLRTDDGRLLRTYRDGKAKLNAYLDDYAFFIHGLLGIHEATGEAKWLEHADRLTKQQIEFYGDTHQGAFFFTPTDHETLIARSKQLTDGAQPSGNSVAAENLLYLARHLDRPEYRQWAERTLKNGSIRMNEFPRIAPRMAVTMAEFFATEPVPPDSINDSTEVEVSDPSGEDQRADEDEANEDANRDAATNAGPDADRADETSAP